MARRADTTSPSDDSGPKVQTEQAVHAEQANRVDKMAVTGAEHIFANCRFYADPDAEATGCALLANQLVPAKAWCIGWVPIS